MNSIPTPSKEDIVILKKFQRDEATAALIYEKLSKIVKEKHNSDILARIAKEEKDHYGTLTKYTKTHLNPQLLYAWLVIMTSRILGITFTLKILEKIESTVQSNYKEILDNYPVLKEIMEEEEIHEQELIKMLEERILDYVGSIVLGLNDALIELTGALAGLTFAFRNTRLIALSGLITGIAASLSMASSEFLAHRAKEKTMTVGKAGKAALYTGVAYILTVIILVLPYLLVSNYILALIMTLASSIIIILVFNLYISVTKSIPFHKNFFEMAGISLGVAGLSFGIGILVRKVLGIEI